MVSTLVPIVVKLHHVCNVLSTSRFKSLKGTHQVPAIFAKGPYFYPSTLLSVLEKGLAGFIGGSVRLMTRVLRLLLVIGDSRSLFPV